MRNSPCARLITRIMPKMMASPRLRRTSELIPFRMLSAMIAARSMARLRFGCDLSMTSHVDDVLLVVVGIGDQVADGGGVLRRLLLIGLEHRPLLVLDLGQEGIAGGVMGLVIDRHLAARAVEGHAGFERLRDLGAVD